MKVTNEQFQAAMQAYNQTVGHALARVHAAIEALPEPLPSLRPLAEMPADVPESPKPSLQDELVTALELCAAVIGAPNDGEWRSKEECDAAFLAAQTALAKAKGGQP